MVCFRKLLVAKILWIRRGECQNFPLKIFCPEAQKNFVGEPFSLSLNSSIENFYASEGYVTIFCRSFLSHSAEKFRRGTP